jgi:hypothetical protein
MPPINPLDIITSIFKIVASIAPSMWKTINSKKRIYIDIPDNGIPQDSVAPAFELMQIITIRCPHDITIEKDDYRELISFTFDSRCRINSVSIGKTSGQNMFPTVNLESNKITIDPFKFRQDDYFDVVINYNGISCPIEGNTGSINKVFLSINTPRSRYKEHSRRILSAFLFWAILFIVGCIQFQILMYWSLIGVLSVYTWLWLVAESPRSHWGKL